MSNQEMIKDFIFMFPYIIIFYLFLLFIFISVGFIALFAYILSLKNFKKKLGLHE